MSDVSMAEAPPEVAPLITTTTFLPMRTGLAVDTANNIWEYQGANGMILVGTYSPGALNPPHNTVAPVVSIGTTLHVGNSLAVTNGTWTGGGTITYTYQWYGHGIIAGATSSTYVMQAADVGYMIQCVVTATNAAGNGTATSNSVGPVLA